MTFAASVYQSRRAAVRRAVGSGLLFFPGSVSAPMNYAANTYPFVQDSCFRYFFGLNEPGLTGIIDCDSGDDCLFGSELTLDDVIWHGEKPSLHDRAASVGIERTRPNADLAVVVQQAWRVGQAIHYTPPYRSDTLIALSELLACSMQQVVASSSVRLIQAIVALRELKEEVEVAEIEKALEITASMHRAAMVSSRPGIMEHAVVGEMEGIVRAADLSLAYPIIFSRHGQVLHNFDHRGRLEYGDLVINDSGSTSPEGYASDITRTLPVGGRFGAEQRIFYNLVLDAQLKAIAAMRPGVAYRSIHLLAAEVLVEGLVGMGILAGDPAELVADGVHAVVFQSGLGHQIGLDAHDMEALGEHHVGYADEAIRSTQFGLNYLRMAKQLRPGMVITVEPGLYFIPALIDRWSTERRFAGAIDYERLRELVGFGGIRLEDNVLVTETGTRVLGPRIPKIIDEVEEAMSC